MGSSSYRTHSDKNVSEAQALLAAANQRYDIVMPFRHPGGGVYLSAIYRKDLKAVEDGDAFYVSGVRSAFSQLTGIGAVMAQSANRVAREQSCGKITGLLDGTREMMKQFRLRRGSRALRGD